jgi:DNA-binding NarL/FixJ family response regulator
MNDEGLARQPLVRIVLADDHSVMRSGLRMFPDAEPDFEVVAEASDERRLHAMSEVTSPTC